MKQRKLIDLYKIQNFILSVFQIQTGVEGHRLLSQSDIINDHAHDHDDRVISDQNAS